MDVKKLPQPASSRTRQCGEVTGEFVGIENIPDRRLETRQLPREFRRTFPFVAGGDRKSTRLNSSHVKISYAVFCLKKKKKNLYPCGNQSAWHAGGLAWIIHIYPKDDIFFFFFF